MANIKSQQKRVRTNAKATERNRSVKAELRTAVRSTREAVQAGDKGAAEAALKTAGVRLDKAASKGVIHKNQAADRKSKLAQQVASI
ncbi:MAG: 30S ribosomal protein S20 [Pseudoclavibacter sp.]